MGTACGYALEGGRALVELMYCDFMGRAGDEIFNQLAKVAEHNPPVFWKCLSLYGCRWAQNTVAALSGLVCIGKSHSWIESGLSFHAMMQRVC